jgi:hypothetical protein
MPCLTGSSLLAPARSKRWPRDRFRLLGQALPTLSFQPSYSPDDPAVGFLGGALDVTIVAAAGVATTGA